MGERSTGGKSQDRQEKSKGEITDRSKRELVRECKIGRDDYLRQEPGQAGKRKGERERKKEAQVRL